MRTCSCDSGLPRRDLYDARGIFCCFICDSCASRKREHYRAEIFANSYYETTEDAEDDC